jgi:hypothetical protein
MHEYARRNFKCITPCNPNSGEEVLEYLQFGLGDAENERE